MDASGRARILGLITVAALATGFPARATAQTDLTGEWAARVHEDQLLRMGGDHGVNIGDYTGFPLNDAARRRADSWEASMQDVPEHQTVPASVLYSVRAGATNLRISKIVDDATQQLLAYRIVRSPGSGGTRLVWMDHRPHPPEYAAHSFQGFSTGRWEGDALVVDTTHVKANLLQLNGVPHSDVATMTERFIRHGDYLTVVTVVRDPVYLEEPFVRSTNLVLDLRQQLAPVRLEIDAVVDHPQGYVPHRLPGEATEAALREFALKYGLPFEATRGGKASTYPEYQATLKRQ